MKQRRAKKVEKVSVDAGMIPPACLEHSEKVTTPIWCIVG